MAKWKKVVVGKIDLDTIGCAFLNAVSRDDPVEVIRGEASEADLADPLVLCIEVGGAGRVSEANFDHHEKGGPEVSATRQAWDKYETEGKDADQLLLISMLVDYINLLDTQGPQVLRSLEGEDFPYLSDIVAGMFLTERNPREQFYKGIEILDTVIRSGQNPVGTIQGFGEYAKAKLENRRRVIEALEKTKWTSTKSGRNLAYLETDFFGAPGALYGHGAEIVVVFSPNFGNPPVPKFTIAGDNIRVDKVLAILNELEAGWGGPPTGTILGSPRTGSKLTLKEVVKIAKENL